MQAAIVNDSVTGVLLQLQRGERSNVDLLLQRYLHRLIGLAASKLGGQPELVDYAEDVALSSLKSLCLGVEQGRFAELRDRDELWRLLATITVRKSISLMRSQRNTSQASELQLAQILSCEPDPAETQVMESYISELFEMLDDDELRQIAKLKIDGYKNAEIAKKLGCVERTIERRLHRIRNIWQKELTE